MRTSFVFIPAAAMAVLLAACSSSSNNSNGADASVPCNQNPFECVAGQTCWPQDQAPTFACLNSGAGKKGDSCANQIGVPTCGDGLACLQVSSTGGTCVSYCDATNPAHACASGETCTVAAIGSLNGPQIHVCVGGATNHDAGNPGADAGVESGADSSAGDATGD